MTVGKDEARTEAFARRKTAHGTGLDAAAQDNLRAALAPYRGRVLSGYMAIRTEVNPLPVMAEWEGPVCVPVIPGKAQPLEFHQWSHGCKMQPGAFGALVPAEPVRLVPRVLIVPLLSFDAQGYRLGYGGGFYDRTLEGLRSAGEVVAVGFAYGVQQVDAVPLEPTDQRLDMIVTEAGILKFG